MNIPNAHTVVQVTLADERVFTGRVLPTDTFTLKLSDGYNIGINPENITDITVISQPQEDENTTIPTISHDSSLDRVDILHTGGTIASKVDYETGGVSNLFSPQQLLGMYPELQDIANVHATFVANMSSDDMRFAHYNLLINAVQKSIKQNNPKAIIITHGTDTLHYTAAALHYALRGVPIPIILVGSQRSSDRGSSDAFTNLQAAVKYGVSNQSQAGVFICMHDSSSDTSAGIFAGVHARKMHTSRRDAFSSINTSLIARITDTIEVISSLPIQQEFTPVTYNESLRIAMIYAHPQMSAQELKAYEGFDGVVVLGTGLGHLPISETDEYTAEHTKIFSALQTLQKEMPIVMTSQCIHGRVSLQVYSPGRRLQDLGVMGHHLSLTPEAAFAKLAYSLSVTNDGSLVSTDCEDIVSRITEESYE